MTALLSPMSLKSSISSHMLGYAILTSSVSTVRRLKPARPIRLEMSLVSAQVVVRDLSQQSFQGDRFRLPVIGDTLGDIPPSLSVSANCIDVLQLISNLGRLMQNGGSYLSSNNVSPPKIAPMKTPSGLRASFT